MSIGLAEAYQADYQVVLIDTNGDQLDVIDASRWQNLEYSRVINDIGNVSITLDSSDRAANYRNKLDMLIEVYRRNKPSTDGGVFELEETFFNRFQNIFEDEAGREWVIITGLSLEHLLSRRVIVVEDDPTGAGGYSTKAGYPDAVMTEFVDNQFINPAVNAQRIAPQFTAAPVGNLGLSTTFERVTTENVLDILKRIAFASNIDFEVIRTNGANLMFHCLVKGTNKTKSANYPSMPYLFYDPKRGNIISPSLIVDRRTEITFVYVQGQGIEEDREVLPVPGSTMTDSIWNRIEANTDARNIEDDANQTDGLIAAGMDYLRQNGIQTDFSFEPDLTAPQGRYNLDWFLGDIVTGSYQGYEKNMRITEIKVTVNAEGETIEPVLTEPLNL